MWTSLWILRIFPESHPLTSQSRKRSRDLPSSKQVGGEFTYSWQNLICRCERMNWLQGISKYYIIIKSCRSKSAGCKCCFLFVFGQKPLPAMLASGIVRVWRQWKLPVQSCESKQQQITEEKCTYRVDDQFRSTMLWWSSAESIPFHYFSGIDRIDSEPIPSRPKWKFPQTNTAIRPNKHAKCAPEARIPIPILKLDQTNAT